MTSTTAIAPSNFSIEQLREQTITNWAADLQAKLGQGVEVILEAAKLIWDKAQTMKPARLAALLRKELGWDGIHKDTQRKAIEVAIAWGEFNPAQLSQLNPFVILKFSAKKYRVVLDRLRGEGQITLEMLQNLVTELLPKVRKTKQDPISGWDRRRGGDPVYRPILPEEIGKLIEEQAELKNVLPQRIITEAVHSWVEQQSAPELIQKFSQERELLQQRVTELQQEVDRLKGRRSPVEPEIIEVADDDTADQMQQQVRQANLAEIQRLQPEVETAKKMTLAKLPEPDEAISTSHSMLTPLINPKIVAEFQNCENLVNNVQSRIDALKARRDQPGLEPLQKREANDQILSLQKKIENLHNTAVQITQKHGLDFFHQRPTADCPQHKFVIAPLLPPAERLAQVMRSPENGWESIREALALLGGNKHEAWGLLTEVERQQVQTLMPPAVKMLEEALDLWDVDQYIEHSGGGVFSVWPSGAKEPESVSSSGVAKFLRDLRSRSVGLNAKAS